MLARDTTVVVLAGDPKQLGPEVQHEKAGHFGLKTSLIERLLQMDLYKQVMMGLPCVCCC